MDDWHWYTSSGDQPWRSSDGWNALGGRREKLGSKVQPPSLRREQRWGGKDQEGTQRVHSCQGVYHCNHHDNCHHSHQPLMIIANVTNMILTVSKTQCVNKWHRDHCCDQDNIFSFQSRLISIIIVLMITTVIISVSKLGVIIVLMIVIWYFQFPNSVCQSSTTGRNGTCYTTSECTAKGWDW